VWVAIKGWGQKEWCITRRQPWCKFSLTSNECRISNQRLIRGTFSRILRWNYFVDRKYIFHTIHSTIHEDDNKLRLRQLNVNETWKISVLTVVLNKKSDDYFFNRKMLYTRFSKNIRWYGHVVPEVRMSVSQPSERCEVDIPLDALNA
jgi:hypothetical protein